MKTLIIVESPSKTKTIQKFLGSDYIILSSYGHIRNLSKKMLGIDIENDFLPDYELLKDRAVQIKEIKSAIKSVTKVLLASDDDREGEAIAWHCAIVFKLDLKEKNRICFHEITKTALEEAVANPRCVDMNKVNSQQARRMLDRIVGFKLSPLLWKYVNPKLSAGRVQSCALKLMVDQEKEIKDFKGNNYYKTTGEFNIDPNLSFHTTLNKELKEEKEMILFLEEAKESEFKIIKLDSHLIERSPPPPYVTSSIQQDCVNRFGLTSKTIMSILQNLYEQGFITYHRTDSTSLSTLIQNNIKEYVIQKYGKNYHKMRQYKSKVKCAQEAHEAIRPTDINLLVLPCTENELNKKVYSLIWKRTVATQMANAQYNQYNIDVSISKREELFIGKIEKLIFNGYKAVYNDLIFNEENEEEEKRNDSINDSINDTIFDKLKVDLLITYKVIVINEKSENGPIHYNEASFIKKMEKIGIGRPSTYSHIMETLLEREYIRKGDVEGIKQKRKEYKLQDGTIKISENIVLMGAEKKKLLVTDIGILTSEFLDNHFKNIIDYNFTSNMELNLDDVVNGDKQWLQVMKDFYNTFKVSLDTINKQDPHTVKNDRKRFLGNDEEGNNVNVYLGKFGPVLEFEKDGKSRFIGLSESLSVETVTLEEALNMEVFPRLLGNHLEKEVMLCKGRYGLYIAYHGKNYKLLENMDKNITLEEGIKCINNTCGTKIIKKIGNYSIGNGQYGHYILFESKFYSLQKDIDIEKLNEDMCNEIVLQGKKDIKKKYQKKEVKSKKK